MSRYSMTLQTITCQGSSEGTDDVYVIMQADGGLRVRIPSGPRNHQEMSNGSTWTVGQTITFNNDVLVTLYDSDLGVDPALSEYLVSYDYTPLDFPSSVPLTNTNGARYTLFAVRND